jgi:hypothetical protein
MINSIFVELSRGVELAVGHSLGGLVLARVVDRVRPARAVYVDPAWAPLPGPEAVDYFRGQKSWSVERLAAEQPRWPAKAVRHKHAALARWDPDSLAVAVGFPGYRPAPPTVPSLAALDGWLTAPR